MESIDDKILTYIQEQWDNSALPCLQEYIKIPNQSPEYDPEWETNGYAEQATNLIFKWIQEQGLKKSKAEIIKEPHRSHMIMVEVEGSTQKLNKHTSFLYAHFDKMPPLDESLWMEGLHPRKPVIKDGYLFGRGAADDGYGPFSCVLTVKALQNLDIPHSRVVIVFESEEESGGDDLEHYITTYKERIGTPEVVVCLDSGCGNYDQLWVTNSLRGVGIFEMKVEILNEGVHSGNGGGIVPETFRICRALLDRIDNPATGKCTEELQVAINEKVLENAKYAGEILGESLHKEFPFVEGTRHMSETNDITELVLNRTWRPSLAITGANGLPELSQAGNVLRPFTSLKLSCRLPPTIKAKQAEEIFKKLLTNNVPYGAKVTLSNFDIGEGWAMSEMDEWLSTSLKESSKKYYGKEPVYYGEGGSIPFIGFLAEMFPQAQILVTGILGPGSNAHGVNESLNLDYTKRIIACMTQVMKKHGETRPE